MDLPHYRVAARPGECPAIPFRAIQMQDQDSLAEADDSQVHPFHLHGHDFFILAQVSMATFSNASQLNLSNPPRRDVAMIPASGFLAIAFQNDNPGVWLAHCHVSSFFPLVPHPCHFTRLTFL